MRTQRARSDALTRSPRGETRGIQIGPRIRVGGTIGKIGEGIKKILPSPGQAIGGAALGIPGMLAGGSIDGSTTPLQKNIAGGVTAAAGGLGLAGLLGGAAGGASGLSGLVGAAKAAGLSLGDFLKNNSGNLADLGLGGAAALNAANLQNQSTKYATGALDTANQSYKQREPLRLAGVEGLLHPEAGNAQKLAGLRANMGVGNPFSKRPLPLTGV